MQPCRFPTQFGGLFLFLPALVRCDFPALVDMAGYPGTKMIPATHALLSILGLKLTSIERKSHVNALSTLAPMDLLHDQGLSLWAGLNATPKTTYMETFSRSVSSKMNDRFRAAWISTLRREKLLGGDSFHLDFHTIPYFGQDEFVERHYRSKRSRSQNSILAFLAQDADSQVVCYSRAGLLRRDQADAVLGFVDAESV